MILNSVENLKNSMVLTQNSVCVFYIHMEISKSLSWLVVLSTLSYCHVSCAMCMSSIQYILMDKRNETKLPDRSINNSLDEVNQTSIRPPPNIHTNRLYRQVCCCCSVWRESFVMYRVASCLFHVLLIWLISSGPVLSNLYTS